MTARLNFPFYKQLDAMDCGPTCIKMIAQYYGRDYSIQYLRDQSYISREGVSLNGIICAAENIGMRSMPVKVPFQESSIDEASLADAPLPCIVHWNQNHFVVVYKIKKNHVWISDPAAGKVKLKSNEFKNKWISDGDEGVALLMEPSPEFYNLDGVKMNKSGFGYLFKYLRPYKQLIFQLIQGLLLGSLFQLTFPFLTQSIVDFGIQNQNIGFIYLILVGQLMLFLSQTSVNFIQSWIILHIGTRINVNLISDFLIKLMRLPIGFFDSKMIGDLLQRIGDHRRIENFLTTTTLSFVFSIFNLIAFGIVLLFYNNLIFSVFVTSSFFYFGWLLIFLKKRREVDYMRFQQLSENQSNLIELIQGMQEIKLQNSQIKRRTKWSHIQGRLFRANIKALSITQYQDVGARFITQFKDILISFIAAKAVIEGSMTLGMMLAVQYIIGQLNSPLEQMVRFLRVAQDAKISLERLGEIHNKDEEEDTGEQKIGKIPSNGDIQIENVSFKYNPLSEPVLEDINLTIPRGKVTAIVGTSGSGKTTLVKLLLGFYEPSAGAVKVGGIHLSNIHNLSWRRSCGAVMQDGFIFSDTIANNISESADFVDRDRLLHAVKSANIQEFIEGLPIGYNTMVGSKGNGISQGQKQRLLIARAIYKDPEFIFFDEATNALDAKNERVILENLDEFFKGRSVIVVAHRLSTVKNADQIVVLERGKIIEKGTHQELVNNKGAYFRLVKDQLELGN